MFGKATKPIELAPFHLIHEWFRNLQNQKKALPCEKSFNCILYFKKMVKPDLLDR
jgi:hypothetical protein